MELSCSSQRMGRRKEKQALSARSSRKQPSASRPIAAPTTAWPAPSGPVKAQSRSGCFDSGRRHASRIMFTVHVRSARSGSVPSAEPAAPVHPIPHRDRTPPPPHREAGAVEWDRRQPPAAAAGGPRAARCVGSTRASGPGPATATSVRGPQWPGTAGPELASVV